MKNQGFFIAAVVSRHSKDIWIGNMCQTGKKIAGQKKEGGKTQKKQRGEIQQIPSHSLKQPWSAICIT